MKKIAIVTGCMGGIGYATAEKLIASGFSVVGMDILPQESIGERIAALGEAFCYLCGNICKASDRERLVARASAEGELRALVNVAGVAPRVRTDLLDMSEESYDRVMEINTKSTLFLTQIAAKAMIRNQAIDGVCGQIVNISSMSAYTSSVSRGEYCISKAGVSMITALFADRLAEFGIPVNEIRPGIIATGMTEKVKEKYDSLIGGGLLPIARWGQPEDVAAAVCALACGSMPYVTGQSIDVDGGFHIRRL